MSGVTPEFVQSLLMPPMKPGQLATFGSVDFDDSKDVKGFLDSKDGKAMRAYIEAKLKAEGIEPSISNVVSVLAIEQHAQEAGRKPDLRNVSDVRHITPKDEPAPATAAAPAPSGAYIVSGSGGIHGVVHRRTEQALRDAGVGGPS